jgi:hypothetical protein
LVWRTSKSYTSAIPFCASGGRWIVRPLVEHHLVGGEGIFILIDRAKFERECPVDLDRPGLVLGNQARILDSLDGDVQFGLALGRTSRGIENIRSRDVRLVGPRSDEIEIVERSGDVRVGLLPKIRPGIPGQLLLLVGVVQQVDELLDGGLVALLLEERPCVLVESHPEERWLLECHRVRVRAGGPVVVPHRRRLEVDHAAAEIVLIEFPVADAPPDLGHVLGLGPRRNVRLGDHLAVLRIRVVVRRFGFGSLRQRGRCRVLGPPSLPEGLVLILGERRDGVDVRALRVARDRVGVAIVAYERSPHLLGLGDPPRVVQRMPEKVINARHFFVVREFTQDALVEFDRGSQTRRHVRVRILVAPRALFVQGRQPIHGVRGRVRLGVCTAVFPDEIFEASNRDLSGFPELVFLDTDLAIEPTEDRLFSGLVVKRHDRRDRVLVILRASRIGIGLLPNLPVRGHLCGTGRRELDRVRAVGGNR